jgi:hypothetical protein
MKIALSPPVLAGNVTVLQTKPFHRTIIPFMFVQDAARHPTAQPSDELIMLMPLRTAPLGVPLGTDAHIEPSHFSIVAGEDPPVPTAQLSVALTTSTA